MEKKNPKQQPGQMVGFDVELKTPLGPIKGKVGIDPGPTRLAELVPTACELTNILVSRAEKSAEKAGRPISCKAGCGACCRQMVPVSAPEAFMIRDFIDSRGPEEREAILARFRKIHDAVKKKNIIDELLDPEYSDDAVLPIAKTYFQMQMPCPFLKDESCGIHPYRPVACREYNVTSPAEWCKDPYSHDIEKVPMPLPFSAPLARLTAELTGTKPCLIPLSLVPAWTDEHKEMRTAEWPGVELFQKFMSQASSKPQL